MIKKSDSTSTSIELANPANMPKPRPAKGGSGKAIFWAVLALVVLGGAVFWLLANPLDKTRWRNEAADMVESWTKDSPFAWLTTALREKPPALPVSVISPPTEKGTLAGRQVNGVIASPVEVGNRQLSLSEMTAREMIERLASPETPKDSPVFTDKPLPPVTEDREIKPDYISRMADWLAARYRPGSAGGTLAMTLQNLNNLCGTTLAASANGGRQGLLRYAFHPGMIQGLYNLYINKFMSDLNRAAQEKGMSESENRNFHRAIAGKATLAANSISGALEIDNLGGRLQSIDDLGQTVVELNAQMAAAVSDLDSLRKTKGSQTQLAATQMRVDGLAARYRRAIENHAAAQRALASEIRQNGGTVLDEDSLLFIAAWIERRVKEESAARQSLMSCVSILRDLAARCDSPSAESSGNPN